MVNICKKKPSALLVSTKIVKKDENTVKHANFMLSLIEISTFQFEGSFQHERTAFCDLRLLVTC